MNAIKLFQKYFHPGQELPLWIRRWKHRLSLLLALIVPGLPQLLSKNRPRFLPGSLLCLFGTGALINMAVSLFIFISSHFNSKAFDIHYPNVFFNPFTAYPQITPSAESPEKLIQHFFWELLYACIFLYVVCAIISFWEQWRQYSVSSKQ